MRTAPCLLARPLNVHIYFYGVVAACLLAFGARAKLGIAFWIITETVLIAAWCIAPDSDSWLAYWRHSILLDPMVLEFGLGCGVAALVAHRPRLPAIPLTVAALVPITIGAWQLHARPMIGLTADPYLRLAYFGTGATLLLTGAVLLERQDRWVAPRWLQALGDASYSLYLWHIPVIIVLGELGRLAAFAWSKGSAVMVLLESAAALLVAFASYRWIERPLLGRVRDLPLENTDSARAA